MAVRSAGLLIHRAAAGGPEVLLAHPGGPFWARKDEGAWSIPKGIVEAGEEDLEAAIRETREELGVVIEGDFRLLGEYRQPGGKIVVAWSVEADLDADHIESIEFEIEWPPKSGKRKRFPEVDRAGWFSLEQAAEKMLKGQRPMLDDLQKQLALSPKPQSRRTPH